MYSVGIDIGYSSIKLVLIKENRKVVYEKYELHKGEINKTLSKLLKKLSEEVSFGEIMFGGITGRGAGLLADLSEEVTVINSIAAIIEEVKFHSPKAKSIIEIGGQNGIYITGFNRGEKSYVDIATNSNCSAGTGSFLEEQLSRLNLCLEDFSTLANQANSIPRIAGRCSVFAKTDITHKLQEGVSVNDILLGLAYAVIRNFRSTVMRKLNIEKPILLAGGIAKNQAIITALKDVLKLNDDELLTPDHIGTGGAIGAAMIALKEEHKINLSDILQKVKTNKNGLFRNEDRNLPPLSPFGDDDSSNKHNLLFKENFNSEKCFIGIDVGSTSTNLVLIDENGEIIDFKYMRSFGRPIDVVKQGLREINSEFGNRLNIAGIGITGSGRHMIGKMIGADSIKDEITSQAKGAFAIDKDVDTIFEIGGQDSKFIRVENGAVTDFQMNKICAAGTGSFIEEQAKKFNIPISEFGAIALSGENPVGLGERCTVFIETAVAGNLTNGVPVKDIAAGLSYSIVRNYLNRVVGQKPIGEKIFLQGGIAYNQGIVNAFRVVTGKEIIVPEFFSVTGAFGVALLTKEEAANKVSSFVGFGNLDDELVSDKIKISVTDKKKLSPFTEKIHNTLFNDYDPFTDREKKTVGIPRALFSFGFFSMFNAFFKALGMNVLLSEPTSEKTIALGQEYSMDEACFPIKLIIGHVAELLKKNVDYIFFPNIYSIISPNQQARKNYGCPYMQLASKMVKQTMELNEKEVKLLSPTIANSLGKEYMAKPFFDIGMELGKSKNQIIDAMKTGKMSALLLEQRISDSKAHSLVDINPNKKTFVIISKIYGVADPILNMGIPDKLSKMGYQVIPFYDLLEGDISKAHPNMYWPFADRELSAAYSVKANPNYYAVYLTHHGCGPDAIVSHYFREIMGDKPYLNIEVDEHSSDVGIITRLEAFINSLEKRKGELREINNDNLLLKRAKIKESLSGIREDSTLYLPYLYPYSEILKAILRKKELRQKFYR